MSQPVSITDAQRRMRLVARHHLARTAADAVEAVRGVVAQHSSDPLTPYLAAWARVPGFATADLDTALYETRTLRRLHAMRRTLFVVPSDRVPVFDGAASRDVARRERRRIERMLDAALGHAHDPAWLRDVERQVLEVLADGRERRTSELGAAVAGLRTEITAGSGRWAARGPLASRLLFLLAMEGRVVRTRPAGTWRSSQYHWAEVSHWVGGEVPTMEPSVARAELARLYLDRHGPATATDLRWWTGWTAKQSAAALEAVTAAAVRLDSGATGYVLPDDLDADAAGAATAGQVGTDACVQAAAAACGGAGPVSLLPGLDSTAMGWKDRGFYLGDHAEPLFDRNGNVGPTVWVDGRIVGGWAQRPDGEVVHRLLEDVGVGTAGRVAEEAAALTAWMNGVVATPRFRTPLERQLTA